MLLYTTRSAPGDADNADTTTKRGAAGTSNDSRAADAEHDPTQSTTDGNTGAARYIPATTTSADNAG